MSATGAQLSRFTVRAMTAPRSVIAVVISAGLSAIPVVGGPVQTVFDAIAERVRYRAEITAREICESVGADTVLTRIGENPELEALLTQAIEAATRTGMEAKRRLLARAAAAALQDDEKVDPASLIISVMSQLEPVHIRALARLAAASTSSRDSDEKQRSQAMIAASEAEAVPVLATLIQTGVAIPTAMVSQFNGTIAPAAGIGGSVLVHNVSTFGYSLLGQLRAADEDSERLVL